MPAKPINLFSMTISVIAMEMEIFVEKAVTSVNLEMQPTKLKVKQQNRPGCLLVW